MAVLRNGLGAAGLFARTTQARRGVLVVGQPPTGGGRRRKRKSIKGDASDLLDDAATTPPPVDLDADFGDVLQHVRTGRVPTTTPAASAPVAAAGSAAASAGGRSPAFAAPQQPTGSNVTAGTSQYAKEAARRRREVGEALRQLIPPLQQQDAVPFAAVDDDGREAVAMDRATGEAVLSSSPVDPIAVRPAAKKGKRRRHLRRARGPGDHDAQEGDLDVDGLLPEDAAADDVEAARARWEGSAARLAALHPAAAAEGGVAALGARREASLQARVELAVEDQERQEAAGEYDRNHGRYIDDSVAGGRIVSEVPLALRDASERRLQDLEDDAPRRERADTHLPKRQPLKKKKQGGASLLLDGVDDGPSSSAAFHASFEAAPRSARDAALRSSDFRADEHHDAAARGRGGGATSSSSAQRLTELVQAQRRGEAPTGWEAEDHGGADAQNEEDDDALISAGSAATGGGVFLLRALQRVGVGSRRDAVAAISAGRVKVNQRVVRDPFAPVTADMDIHVEGRSERLRFAPSRLWLFHKPAMVLVGNARSAERLLFRRYAQMLGHEHMVPIGSLPFAAHGLLLLTNDGELARFLSHPSTGLQQTWVLRVSPPISPLLAHKLNTTGVDINGVRYKDYEFSHFGVRRSRQTIRLRVNGGKTPVPVHELMQHLGRRILRGSRRGVGPFYIGGLKPGGIKEVAIPPYFARYVSDVWQPFVDRDWAHFRRLRIRRLRTLSRYRHLTDAERDELDTFNADELRDAAAAERAEVDDQAAQFAESIRAGAPPIDKPPLPPRIEADDVVPF